MERVASYSAEDWQRLGDLVRRRRAVLDMTQDDLADSAGVAPGTIRNIEQGKQTRELTLPKICRALGWLPESYTLILIGGEPMEEERPEPPPTTLVFPPRPDGISDDDWAELQSDVTRDYERALRLYRRR